MHSLKLKIHDKNKKIVVFLYISNNWKLNLKRITLTIPSKEIKYLGINLGKVVHIFFTETTKYCGI